MKLAELSPCREGVDRVRLAGGTLRLAWGDTLTLDDHMWLIGKAHTQGTLSRQRLVEVALRCALTVAHKMSPECLPHLADLQAWCAGDDTVDLEATKNALWTIRAADADAYAYAAPYADAAYADAAYVAVSAAYAYADARGAMVDVVVDAINIDEVCAALGLDPDEKTPD